MEGLSFLYDENADKWFAQIDLEMIANLNSKEMQQMVDTIINEARRNDKNIIVEREVAELISEGKAE